VFVAAATFRLSACRCGVRRARPPTRIDAPTIQVRYVVSVDERLPATFARLHAGLARQGQALPTMDLLIAGTALNEGAALLTANDAQFAWVAGLLVIAYR